MRVPDFALKSTAFIVSLAGEGSVDEYDFEGTGFLIGLPSEAVKGQSFFYFVTAAHVVSRASARYGIRVNLKRGGTEIVPVAQWYLHPTDESSDVAVTPFRNKYEEYDIQFIGENSFRSKEYMQAHDMGLGDEVWFPGLFTLTQQESDHRNLPILRMGNIAMLPDGPVPTEIGLMDAYLVEARSIGGISGSPVFSRRTISILWNDEGIGIDPKKPVKGLYGMTGEIHLIGMMHGHWDVKESEINQPRLIPTRDPQGVNVGIGIVTPLSKILETVNRPELADIREAENKRYSQNFAAKAD